jgi:hypothetical protein
MLYERGTYIGSFQVVNAAAIQIPTKIIAFHQPKEVAITWILLA